MLYQTDLNLRMPPNPTMQSELAVKIHGAAMKAIPADYAAKMHANVYHPFSIFTMDTAESSIVRISALSDAARVIPQALTQQPSIRVYGAQGAYDLQVQMQNVSAPLTADMLADQIPKSGCRLRFVTPAMIRIQSYPSARPDICGYFYSVILKYNEFERGSLDYSAFQEAFRAVRFGSYQLSSAAYQITGRTFPGMTGYCDLYFPQNAAQNRLLRLCLGYSSYSGIGSKTTQGMGGILLEPLP